MYPEVRVYADPLEGLDAQLTQLRGLITRVPPLIEADRQKRWDEISSRPSDGEDGDVIDVYSAEAARSSRATARTPGRLSNAEPPLARLTTAAFRAKRNSRPDCSLAWTEANRDDALSRVHVDPPSTFARSL
jgi:hypothetical protein